MGDAGVQRLPPQDTPNLVMQNFLEPKVRLGGPVIPRIHSTPGYSRGVMACLTFHIFGKE